MKIKSLVLENYKKFNKKTINFCDEQGVSLLKAIFYRFALNQFNYLDFEDLVQFRDKLSSL